MPYTLSTQPNFTVEVSAHATPETVDTERQAIVRSLRGRVQVPGFRRGKAPQSVVESRFAEDIRSELAEHLAGRLWEEVFDAEESLQPLTNPRVKEQGFDDDGTFRFVAELEVRPSYDLPELEAVELPEVNLEVSDAEIDDELAKLQQEHATWVPADDAAAEDGLLVEADLHGEMEGSDDEPYTEEGARFRIGADEVPDEINEALQGARVGEQRVAERRFPDDDPKRERAGKTVRYTIDVKALKRQELPPVDDELAKGMGLESLDELRERISEVLQRQKVAQRRDRWRRHILDHLESGIDEGDLPKSLVQSAVREDLNRFAYSMAMQGMAPDSDQVNWQEMAARFEPQARRKVLDELVLEQLSEAWGVEVPESDVDAFIHAEAHRLGLPPAEHKANLAKEHRLEQIRHAARVAATVDEMIRRAGGEVTP